VIKSDSAGLGLGYNNDFKAPRVVPMHSQILKLLAPSMQILHKGSPFSPFSTKMVSGDSNGVCSFHSLFPHYDGLRGPF
jgi:hypothetical protein